MNKISILLTLLLTLMSCHNYNNQTIQQIKHLGANTTVWIGKGNSHGTGFIVKHQGVRYIATNSHVCNISNNSEIDVKTNLNETVYKVNIIIMDRDHDLCLTTVPKELRSNGLKLGIQPHELDAVHVIGFPSNNLKSYVSGVYTGERKDIAIDYPYSKKECPIKMTRHWFYQTLMCTLNILSGEITASIFGGNSGSAVLNNKGFIVGVVYASSSNTTVSNYMIPVRFLRKLIENQNKVK